METLHGLLKGLLLVGVTVIIVATAEEVFRRWWKSKVGEDKDDDNRR